MISQLNINAAVRWPIMVLITIFGSFLIGSNGKTGPSHDRVVVCYISSWAVYRPNRGSFVIEHIDPNLCTHIVYAFAGLDISKDAMISLDPWQDLNDGKKGYERVNALKKSHPHLKVTLAIGGWNEGSKNYSMLAADPSKRQRFAKNAVEFIRKHKFDGLDLDWEYPTQRGGDPTKDKQNFVALVKDLREEFNRFGLLLTSAFGASKNVIDDAFDIPELSKYLDYLHIMCYDYSGSWDRKIGPNAPLERGGQLSVKFSIEYLIGLGAPPSKLVMGVPFYGRTFKTMNNEGNFDDAAEEFGFQGPYTREKGFLGYNEICPLISNKSSGWSKSWDNETSQAISKYYESETGIRKVVVYDDTRSMARKMRFAVKYKLAGVMIWSIDTDDFLGDCEPEMDTFADFTDIQTGVKLHIPKRINANFPLLKTINEAINLSLEEIHQEDEIKQKEHENIIPHGNDEEDDDHKNKNSAAAGINFSNNLCGFLCLVLAFRLLC